VLLTGLVSGEQRPGMLESGTLPGRDLKTFIRILTSIFNLTSQRCNEAAFPQRMRQIVLKCTGRAQSTPRGLDRPVYSSPSHGEDTVSRVR
jgi:hypothetical protein